METQKIKAYIFLEYQKTIPIPRPRQTRKSDE